MAWVAGNAMVQRRHLNAPALDHLQEMVAIIMQHPRQVHPRVVALAGLDQLVDVEVLGRVALTVINKACKVHNGRPPAKH